MYKYNLGLRKSLVNIRWLFAIMWCGDGRVGGGGGSGGRVGGDGDSGSGGRVGGDGDSGSSTITFLLLTRQNLATRFVVV